MPTNKDGKSRETTLIERIKVIEAHASGDSYHEIEAKLPVSKAQAQQIITHWEETDKIHDDPQSGRPKILSERDKRHLNRLADADPEATLADITIVSGVGASDHTVGNFLHSEG